MNNVIVDLATCDPEGSLSEYSDDTLVRAAWTISRELGRRAEYETQIAQDDLDMRASADPEDIAMAAEADEWMR